MVFAADSVGSREEFVVGREELRELGRGATEKARRVAELAS